MRKKVIFLLVGIVAISLLSVIGIKSFNKEKIKQEEVPKIEEKVNKKENEEKTDIITNESNQEELKNSKEEKIVEQENKVDNKVNNDVPKNSTTSSSTTSTNTKSNNQNNTVIETPKQDPVVPEQKPSVSVEQPKPATSYVGVPNPNDFYYSFHKGHIDKGYSTLDGCNSRTAEVSLIDTVDIINTTCFEVLDGQGTVLGIYMYVKCKSGNCDRYKTLVGIETN